MNETAAKSPSVAPPFPNAEYRHRWDRVHDEMERRGLKAAVVWGRTASTFDRAADILYLSNYFSSKVGQGFDAAPHSARAYCAVIFRHGHEPELIADDPDLRASLTPIRNHSSAADPVDRVIASLRDTGTTGDVGFVGTDFFPMKYWWQIVNATPNIRWLPSDDLVRTVRMIKSPRERDVIRRAGAIASRAMTHLMEALIACETESEAAARAAAEIVRGGGIVDKIQISHGDTIGYTCGDPLAGYRPVAPKPGDMVRAFLIGPMYQGYYLDPGRTAVAGKAPDREQAELIEACIGIVDAIAAFIKPGVSFYDAAALGDRMVADFGPDADPAAEKFPFFGHPHGLYFEGPPYISTVLDHQNAVFEEGMLIGVEAFLARTGVGNAGFEQNYLVGADGLELVTDTPMRWH